MDTQQAYGLWLLVIVNSAIFILFAVSFFHPKSARDWRAMGASLKHHSPPPFRALAVCAVVVASVLLAGCGNQSGSGSMGGMDMGGTAKSAKATLAPANALAGAGTANVAVVKNQVHVDVRGQQLRAGITYTVHLHKGSCAAIGDILKTVGKLNTDATGAGATHLEYAGSDFPTPAFVDVHMPGGTEGPAVCGDLQ